MNIGPKPRNPVTSSVSVSVDGDEVAASSDISSDTDVVTSSNCMYRAQELTVSTLEKHKKLIGGCVLLLLLAGYTVYFVFAILYNVEWAAALIVFTALAVAGLLYVFVRDHFGDEINRILLDPLSNAIDNVWPILKWFFYPAVIIGMVLYLALDVIQEVKQLQSLIGFVTFVILMYVTSKHPNKVIWRPVLWGFILQFLLAIFVLRWKYGYIAVKFLSDEIIKFITFGFEGAAVVFGDPFLLFHPFAFMGMPLLVYLGAVMAILHYYGLTQLTACKLGWLMQKSLGTTAIETLNVCANIFLDGMDTMLMLRYYLDKLTLSEFNCLLVGNHATVAGFVFALFVLFGAPPQHLLSAAVMSAPATIAICKLNYPETEESTTKNLDEIQLSHSDEINVFEATANGAAVASKTVAAVIGCYIAFLSLLAFINAVLSWIGGRVGFPELSFEFMCSYIMWPIAIIIGIDTNECREAAKLLGIKIFATEILAYQELGRSVDAGLLSLRSQALTTYAMCGFSSLSTLAIAVGVWNSLCPQRVKQMAASMFRVLVQANVSCFMTACVAGLFYNEDLAKFFETPPASPRAEMIAWKLGLIPGYKELMGLAGL